MSDTAEREQRAEFIASLARAVTLAIDRRDKAADGKEPAEDVGEAIALSLVSAIDGLVKSAVRSPIHAHAQAYARLADWDEERRELYVTLFDAEYEKCRVDNLPLEEISTYIRSLEKALDDEVFKKRAQVQGASAYRADRESTATEGEIIRVREFDRGTALKEAQLKTEKRAKLTKDQQHMADLVKLGIKFDDAKGFLKGLPGATPAVETPKVSKKSKQEEEDERFLED